MSGVVSGAVCGCVSLGGLGIRLRSFRDHLCELREMFLNVAQAGTVFGGQLYYLLVVVFLGFLAHCDWVDDPGDSLLGDRFFVLPDHGL